VVAVLSAVSFAAAFQEEAAKPATGGAKATDRQIFDGLRDAINTGRNLFNTYGDYSGCYRVFQGALLAVRPQLAHRPDLQKVVDAGLADAELRQYSHQRAFALRKVLDTVRASLKSGEAVEATLGMPEKVGPSGAQKAEKLGPPGEKLGPPAPPWAKPAEKLGAPAAKKTEKSLWDRLGGLEGVRRLVDEVTAKVGADPKVNVTRNGKFKFTDKQVAEMKKKLVELVSEITGGPLIYTGKTMRDAHEGMGITDAEFDAFMNDLVAVLNKNGVAEADVASIRKKVEGTRADIVENPKGEEKKQEEKKGDEKKPAGTASVSGRITYKGKPLPAGSVTFNKAKAAYVAKIQPDGTYELKNLPDDSYQIAIETASAKAPTKDGREKPAEFVPIPAQYADPLRSGLTAEIKAGSNTLDFDLN
jgi:hemoglobin